MASYSPRVIPHTSLVPRYVILQLRTIVLAKDTNISEGQFGFTKASRPPIDAGRTSLLRATLTTYLTSALLLACINAAAKRCARVGFAFRASRSRRDISSCNAAAPEKQAE
eukprot:6318888-Pyramimonas_sp.AAC.3